jgi:CRP-like cAMP-binding protein
MIFKKGETGTKFYIIIRGNCSVFDIVDKTFKFSFREFLEYIRLQHQNILKVNNKSKCKFPAIYKLIKNTNAFKTSPNLDMKFYDKLVAEVKDKELLATIKLSDLCLRLTDEQREDYRIVYQKKLNTVRNGCQFGELALIESKTRSATIIANEFTECAVLDKAPFNRILKNYEKEKMDRQISDMRKFLIFNSVYRHDRIKTIYEKMNKIKLIKGQKLVKEGDAFDRIYVVKEGELRISKRLHIHMSNTQSLTL